MPDTEALDWVEPMLDRMTGGDHTLTLILQLFLVVLAVVVTNFFPAPHAGQA